MHLIKEHVSLADKNWFKTGGLARYYAAPTTAQEFQEAIRLAHAHNLAICMLGEGANALISDDGFEGMVISPKLTGIEQSALVLRQAQDERNQCQNDKKNNTNSTINPKIGVSPKLVKESEDPAHPELVEGQERAMTQLTAGAGVTLPDLITYCLDNNLGGLEEFSGIPGSVGGSVFINVHYFQFLLSQFLTHATVIHAQTGELLVVDNAWFNFGYNHSTLHEGAYYLVDATFKLKKLTDLEAAYARGRSVEIIRHRTARYPSARTCGSFFRNFYPEEVTVESGGKKMIYVAYYLDKIGIKGALSCGDASVSYQHANMIVTQPGATTNDVITLVRMMQEKVRDTFGITPQPECRLIGFKEYPLYKL